MRLSDYLLSLLGVYGPPVLFLTLVIGSAGIPMPATLMLIAVGSFAAQGAIDLSWAILAASAGSIVGDNLGYALGRWGGHRVKQYVGRLSNGTARLEQAAQWSARWGGLGVFLSRWLLSPLGPWVNLASGLANYPWPRFFFWDVVGEVLWVVLYVMLGKFFSDRVQALNELLGNLTKILVGLLVAVLLGWKLVQYLRSSPAA
ncbi:MAG TPA: DedA family protein, partial [Blastocatellia bacterium]|nr:DedA family protein [Blastocatellia bacterium]